MTFVLNQHFPNSQHLSNIRFELSVFQGVGIAFGPDVTKRWCRLNGVTGIIRSHEARKDGYAVELGGLCTTVRVNPPFC